MWGIKKNIMVLALLLPLLLEASNPNTWSGLNKPAFWNNWTIGVNTGLTSYFGDISLYDENYFAKLNSESGFAIDGLLSKNLFNKFSLSGQILYGNFKSDYSQSLNFKTSFLEYNLHARWHILKTILPYSQTPIEIELYAGIGQFIFKSSQYTLNESESQAHIHSTGIPEFVYFFGGSLSYQLTNNWNIVANLSIRQAQNDKLDNLIKKR